MNELTRQLLKTLWTGNPSFKEVGARMAAECNTMSPPEAAVIGRDLILRKDRLYTRHFSLAAHLASNGGLGSDGFMDFADCVAVLPEERYQRIVADHDTLIDDPVSSGFGEFYFVSRVSKVFDIALVDDEYSGFLYYLVMGGEVGIQPQIYAWDDLDAAERFPRLYQKYGHLLRAPKPHRDRICSSDNRVTLDDLIP